MMLPILLVFTLGTADVPTAASAAEAGPVALQPQEADEVPGLEAGPGVGVSPWDTNPVLGTIKETGLVFIQPFQAWKEHLPVLVPAALLTVAALHWDVILHHEIRDQWPDPQIGDRRLSYWGSYLGEGFVDVGIFAAVGLLGGVRGPSIALEGLEALAVVAVTSRVGKWTFRTERPSTDPDHKHYFTDNLGADAMPGGHSMSAFATAAVLAEEYPSMAPVFYTLAMYVNVARVQQDTHWVSDVIVGTAMGIVFGRAAVAVHRQLAGLPGRTETLRLSVNPSGLTLEGRF